MSDCTRFLVSFSLFSQVIKQVALAKAGEKVGSSEAVLMTKMGMKPFMYGLKVTHVFDGEGMVDPAILDIDDADIRACFQEVCEQKIYCA